MAKEKKEQASEGKVLAKTEVNHLVLQGDPAVQLEFAQKASKALMEIVGQKKKPVIINGEQYLEFEDWQTIARFYGASVGTEWSRPLKDDTGKTIGYEAKAIVHMAGEIISSAEAMTMYAEKNWVHRDEFMLRSMAQTRAGAKALRNAFAWVAVLAGYKPTPAEEMPKEGFSNRPAAAAPTRPAPAATGEREVQYPPKAQQSFAATGDLECGECGEGVSMKVKEYSEQKFGRVLCYKCQRA